LTLDNPEAALACASCSKLYPLPWFEAALQP